MFPISKTEFQVFSDAWKAKDSHTAPEHVIYNLIRGKALDRGFTPNLKHTQGNDPYYAFFVAKLRARYILRQGKFLGLDISTSLEQQIL